MSGVIRVCTACGEVFQGNYCPRCGDGPATRALREKAGRTAYRKYIAYYPDKLGAVRALRKDTHMSRNQANTIIDQLFSGDDALARRQDAGYYLELYRPDKAKAVRALRQELGFSPIEAQELVDAAYQELPTPSDAAYRDRSKHSDAAKLGKATLKGTAIAAGLTAYTAFKVVAGLVKKYK